MSWKLGKPLSQNPRFGGWRLLRSVGQYFFSRSGPMAAATTEVGPWLKSRPDLHRPDTAFLISPFSLDPDSGRPNPDAFHGFNMVPYPVRQVLRRAIKHRVHH